MVSLITVGAISIGAILLEIHAFTADFPVAIARGLRLAAAADLAFRFPGGRGCCWFLVRQ